MRQEKQLLLDEIKEQIDKHDTFIVMSYSGFNANVANNFRAAVEKLGGDVEIVRKRILQKAAEASGIKLECELPGHIGMVFAGKDPLETTKMIYDFSQQNEKSIKVVGGRFEGEMYSGEQLEMLSKLPNLDGMRAQLLSVLEAPLSQTLAVMNALLTSPIYCLDNKCKQESN